jgi:hypothetical protein
MAIENRSPLAPTALPPSVQSSVYEVKVGQNLTRRGPLRFEEGLATDTDIPNEFTYGMRQGYITGPGGHNANVYEKPAAETMRERVHMGSAAWTDSPSELGAFAAGASDEAERNYIQVSNSGGRINRIHPAVVRD